jgi:hypothetical protein
MDSIVSFLSLLLSVIRDGAIVFQRLYRHQGGCLEFWAVNHEKAVEEKSSIHYKAVRGEKMRARLMNRCEVALHF